MHCKATKVLGSRMQHGNANEMLGLSDAMKTTRSPQRRARRKGNKMLGRSDATKTTRSPQQRAHCRATKVSVHGLQSRQCAAHSGARTARETKSLGCRMRRRQRAAHSGCRATKFVLSFGSNQAMRSPQRRTHCKDTKFFELIHGSPMMLVLVPSDMIWYVIWYLYYQRNEISVANRQRFAEKKSWINKNLCMSSTAGFRKWHNKSSPWNFAENEHESIRNSHITNASLYCD